MMMNSPQMTVCWHVDNPKVSHKEESAVNVFVLKICKIFGNSTKLSRGKVHEYLGMDMDWSQYRTMIVSMIKYLQKTIDDFPEVIRSNSATYAAEHLFTARDGKDRKTFLEEQTHHFHHTEYQLLFLCLSSHPDIQTFVAFITTRVSPPDEYDFGKLKWGLKYLKSTL